MIALLFSVIAVAQVVRVGTPFTIEAGFSEPFGEKISNYTWVQQIPNNFTLQAIDTVDGFYSEVINDPNTGYTVTINSESGATPEGTIAFIDLIPEVAGDHFLPEPDVVVLDEAGKPFETEVETNYFITVLPKPVVKLFFRIVK